MELTSDFLNQAMKLDSKEYPWPKHDTDIKVKSEAEWNRKMAEALLATAAKHPSSSNYMRRQDYLQARMYAEGNQSTDKYQKLLTKVNEQNERVGYFNYDWSITSVIPKYRNVVLGYVAALEYDIVVQAVDQYAEDERKAEKYKIWVDKMMGQKMAEIEKLAGTPLMQQKLDYLPQSLEELEIYMENQGLKLPDEMSFEEALDICKYVNDWVQTFSKIDEDLFDLAIACTKTYTDIGGRVRVRYCDMLNMIIVGQSDRLDYTNVLGIGELKMVSIHELKEMAGDQFTEKEYHEISVSAGGKFGNPSGHSLFNDQHINTDQVYGYEWDNTKVLVFDCQYDSNDPVTQFKKHFNEDESRYYNKPRDYKPRGKKDPRDAVKVTHLNTKYECVYVVGTSYVFNYGKVKDIVDDPRDLRRTQYDYTIFKIGNKSTVEHMIPVADSIQLTQLKLQALKAKAKPMGVKFNLKAIENINYGGTVLNPKQVVQIYHDTGDVLYDSDPHYQMDNPYIGGSQPNPIEELKGGIGNAFIELLNARNADIQLIENITGLNEIFTAATPQKGQLVGTAQIANQQAVSSLRKLINARRLIMEVTVQKMGAKLQWIAKYGGIDNYKEAIGSATVERLKVNTDFSLRSMGMKLEARPTDEEKRTLYEAAMQALQVNTTNGKGGIALPDFLMVKRKIDEGRLRAAEALLAFRMEQQRKKDMEHDQALSQSNAEAHANSARVAEDERRKSEQQSTMNEIVKEKVKKWLEMMKDNNKAKNDAMILAMQTHIDLTSVEREFSIKEKELLGEVDKLTAQLEMSQQPEAA